MKYFYNCVVFLLIVVSYSLKAQTNEYWKRHSPDSVIISDKDLKNFWIAFDNCQKEKDSVRQISIIQRQYFDKGTVGLKGLITIDNLTPSMYVHIIRRYNKYFQSIRATSLTYIHKSDSIRLAYKMLKKLYPAATFSDIYIMVTPFKHGGTPVNGGFIVGVEMISKTDKSNLSEMSKSLANFIGSPNFFLYIIIHENAHTMQINTNTDNLLARCLVEGGADFVTVTTLRKGAVRKYINDYGEKHEKELWLQLQADMKTNAHQNWFWTNNNNLKVPDLGYFMGYKICESYYRNAKDKKKAMKDIIEMSMNPQDFLKASKYADKFKN